MQRDASSPIVVARFAKNSRENLVVALSTYKSTPLVDVRVYVPGAEGGGEKPTPKGISINVGLLQELRAALEAAEREATRLGWISPQVETGRAGGAA